MTVAKIMPPTSHLAQAPAVDSSHKDSAPGVRNWLYYLILLWGVLGVLALLVRALWRMAPIALEPIRHGELSGFQVAIYATWVAFNGYAEGYRAFQKAFCPRVVARAHHLASAPSLVRALLAPLYCLSLFHANRKGLTVAWVMVAVIFGLVVLLGHTPQPWRGIVDGGVVTALAWGASALLIFALRTLATGVPPPARINLPKHP